MEEYNLHHITLRSLQPDTDYYYVIGTESNVEFDNEGQAFQTTTLPEPSAPSAEAKTVYGSVSNESGNPAEGAIVFVTADRLGDLSSLVKSTGSWAVSLSQARDESGLYYSDLEDSDQLNILVQGVPISKTIEYRLPVSRAQPVPELIFGQPVVDVPAVTPMAEEEEVRSATQGSELNSMVEESEDNGLESLESQDGQLETEEDEAISGRLQDLLGEAEPLPVESSASTELELSSETVSQSGAEKENDQITYTTESPKIKGEAKPNVEVKIQIHSENQYEEIVMADETGDFELDLEALGAYLEPGEHSVTYSYVDPDTGEDVIGTKTFVVEDSSSVRLAQANTTNDEDPSYGSGDPYPMEASPSPTSAAGLDPTPGPSSTPTPRATSTPTPTRSAIFPDDTTNTSDSTPSTTSTTDTREQHFATDSSPKAGSIEATLLLVLGGVFFLFMGGWSWWLAAELQEA